MYRRVPLWSVALLLFLLAGLTVAQGYQPNFVRNFVGAIRVYGDLTADSVTATTVTGTSVISNGNVVAALGGQFVAGPLIVGNGATTGALATVGAGLFTLTGVEDGDVHIVAPGAGELQLQGQSVAIAGVTSIGGGATFTKFLSDTVAVTGASINAGLCANQGTAITLTGAAAGDSCYLGLSASPGNGLAYSCVTGSNSCQIVACNASAGSLTSLTGTHRCTVIH